MGIGEWLSQNWFNVFSTVGIMGSFWIGIVALRSETKTRRVANLLTVTANYREIWKEYYRNPQLTRVLDASANVVKKPVTPEEELFVGQITDHFPHQQCLLRPEGRFVRRTGRFPPGHRPILLAAGAKGSLVQNQTAAKSRFCSLH
jgi:hypothetical protein